MSRKPKAPTATPAPQADPPAAGAGKARLQEPDADIDWFDKRLDFIGRSRSQLSIMFDPSARNWLQKIITGARRCQIGEAVWLAEQLRVPLSEFVARLGFKAPGATVRVIGSVRSNSLINPLHPERQFDTPAPADVRETTVACVADPDHSPALVYAGAIFFYTPSANVRPDAFGRLSVLECGDMLAPIIGTLGRGSGLGRARITLLDGTDRDTTMLAAAYPIEWVRIT